MCFHILINHVMPGPISVPNWRYRQTFNISCTSVGNTIVDHSDVSGAAPTTSSFLTEHLDSIDWAKTTARRDENHLSLVILCVSYERFYGKYTHFSQSIRWNGYQEIWFNFILLLLGGEESWKVQRSQSNTLRRWWQTETKNSRTGMDVQDVVIFS